MHAQIFCGSVEHVACTRFNKERGHAAAEEDHDKADAEAVGDADDDRRAVRPAECAPAFLHRDSDRRRRKQRSRRASNGHMQNCFKRIPAVKPETYTLPRPLFAACMTMLPMAVMEV